MAKTGVFDSDPAMVAKATELKKELQRLVRAIVDDEDFSTQTIDQAKDTLSALKELKFKKRSLSLKLNDVLSCPEEFRCPLSKELMRDPVIVSTGEVGFLCHLGFYIFLCFFWFLMSNSKLLVLCWCFQFLQSPFIFCFVGLRKCRQGKDLRFFMHLKFLFCFPFTFSATKRSSEDLICVVRKRKTYDRPFIQKGLKAGNRICPRTQQVLSHTILTPNHLVREMISQWCKNRGIELSDPVLLVNEDGITESERDHFLSLLQKMSSGLPEQKEAAKELRSLTKRMPSFRALFGESIHAIPQLLSPLSEGKFEDGIHPELQEDVITTLLNLSIHDNNKKLVAESPMVIPLLIEALQSGTIQTRSNAAAALFTLSALDSNKALIGKSGALKPLITLLDEGHPLAMKDVASAIFNLCITHENKARAVRDGAVRTILKKIRNRMHVDELLAILAMLSSHPKAVEEMGELGAVPCLLRVIRETNCGRNKENCIAVLHTICLNDRTKWKEIREEENTYGTISELAQNGTSRSKRKASGILDRLNRTVNLTHTA